jgi:hypothetical protein
MGYILSALAGISLGLSSGFGFNGLFKQPKNIRIQIFFFVIGVIFCILLFTFYI